MQADSQRMNFSYGLAWNIFRAMFKCYFRWRVYHPERVPLTGPIILAGNHASFLDPPLIGTPIRRRLTFLARDTLFRYPGVKQLLHSWNAVPVARDTGGASGIRVILDALSRGNGIVMFPEGTRTLDGSLRPARSGVGLIVAKSGAPVVPVRLFGTFDAYGKHRTLPHPVRVTVVYGELMRFDQAIAEAAQAPKERVKQIYQEISSQIMDVITQLKPDDGAK
jgi:1-acyl-sn-glycerol-3-phosphate acyltransferase